MNVALAEAMAKSQYELGRSFFGALVLQQDIAAVAQELAVAPSAQFAPSERTTAEPSEPCLDASDSDA